MPLVFTPDNPTSATQAVELAALLPAGVQVASVDDAPVQSDPPTWQVAIAPRATRRVRFSVVLPDAVGDVVVSSSVRVNGQAISDSPTVTQSVPATTDASLAQTLATLEATVAAPADQGHLAAAIALLRAAQAAPTGPPALELRIRLAAEAAEALASLSNTNVSTAWREVDDLIAAWQRRLVRHRQRHTYRHQPERGQPASTIRRTTPRSHRISRRRRRTITPVAPAPGRPCDRNRTTTDAAAGCRRAPAVLDGGERCAAAHAEPSASLTAIAFAHRAPVGNATSTATRRDSAASASQCGRALKLILI